LVRGVTTIGNEFGNYIWIELAMPLTFPSHALAVLPLKIRWPCYFDGVALVVGSAVPVCP
jgi:hypothetical protein